jgi:hypothetical protein
MRAASVMVCVMATIGVLMAGDAAATATYVYEGENFTIIGDNPDIPGTYTTDMRVTGRITFAAPLAPNSQYTDRSIVSSVSFSDGR